MGLADTVASTCAFLNLPAGVGTTTTDATSRFLRPITDGFATATAVPLKVGRTLIILEVEVRDDHGKLAVKTSQRKSCSTGNRWPHAGEPVHCGDPVWPARVGVDLWPTRHERATMKSLSTRPRSAAALLVGAAAAAIMSSPVEPAAATGKPVLGPTNAIC